MCVEKQQALTSRRPGSGSTAWCLGAATPAKPANEVTPDLADSKPANEVTPDFSLPISPPTGNQDRATSACEPYNELIIRGSVVDAMAKPSGRTWFPITDFLAVSDGEAFCSQAPWNNAARSCGDYPDHSRRKAQVHYGSGPMVRDPQSGKYRRTRLFVLTLRYSRKSVRLLLFRSSSRVWAELHEKRFVDSVGVRVW